MLPVDNLAINNASMIVSRLWHSNYIIKFNSKSYIRCLFICKCDETIVNYLQNMTKGSDDD